MHLNLFFINYYVYEFLTGINVRKVRKKQRNMGPISIRANYLIRHQFAKKIRKKHVNCLAWQLFFDLASKQLLACTPSKFRQLFSIRAINLFRFNLLDFASNHINSTYKSFNVASIQLHLITNKSQISFLYFYLFIGCYVGTYVVYILRFQFF